MTAKVESVWRQKKPRTEGSIVCGYKVLKAHPDKDLLLWESPKGNVFRIEDGKGNLLDSFLSLPEAKEALKARLGDSKNN